VGSGMYLGLRGQADLRAAGSRLTVNVSSSAAARRSSSGNVGVVPPASNRATPGRVIPARSASCRWDKPIAGPIVRLPARQVSESEQAPAVCFCVPFQLGGEVTDVGVDLSLPLLRPSPEVVLT
jgi:hypothetical protein